MLCPCGFKINNTSWSFKSASYIDILLKIDINNKLTIKCYDKKDVFSLLIVNSHVFITMFHYHMYMVFNILPD